MVDNFCDYDCKLLKSIEIGYRVVIFNELHDNNKFNLILDLDQTLIDTEYSYINNNENTKPKLYLNEKNGYVSIIYGRKYMFEFLNKMKDKFNIYIYTNSIETYAQQFHDHTEKELNCKIYSGIVSREDSNNNNFIKKLEDLIYRNITKENSIIIDDRTDIWYYEYQYNVIQIKAFSYHNHKTDYDMKMLLFV